MRPVRGREQILKSLTSHLMEALKIVQVLEAEKDSPFASEGYSIESAEKTVLQMESCADIRSAEVQSLLTHLQRFIDDQTPTNKKSRLNEDDALPLIDRLTNMHVSASQCFAHYSSLFEWQDGPLLLAMKAGEVFVMDEINLAEDAVIEVKFHNDHCLSLSFLFLAPQLGFGVVERDHHRREGRGKQGKDRGSSEL